MRPRPPLLTLLLLAALPEVAAADQYVLRLSSVAPEGTGWARELWAFSLARLKPVLDEEFRRAGFINLAEGGVGPHVLFTRHPVRSLDELRRTRLWVWDLDDVMRAELPELGVRIITSPLDGAARIY